MEAEAEEGRFIDPMTDPGFKKIFGSEESKVYLIDFLNSLLGKGIMDITYMDKEIPATAVEEKGTVYDILCSTGDGERFILEMQVRFQDFYMERTLYYICRSVTGQLKKGGHYSDIRPVYGVFLTAKDPLYDGIDYIRDYQWVNVRDMDDRYCGIRQIFIDLGKFDKRESECRTRLEEWIYILKHMGNMNKMPFKDREEMFRYLEEYAEKSNMTPDERLVYDIKVDGLRSYEWSIEYEKKQAIAQGMAEGLAQGIAQGIEQGLTQGIEQGMAQGIEQGLVQGIEQGMAEGIKQGVSEGIRQGALQERETVALRMKKAGMPLSQIAEFTGLGESEIEKLL